jgi:hypothetical protein
VSSIGRNGVPMLLRDNGRLVCLASFPSVVFWLLKLRDFANVTFQCVRITRKCFESSIGLPRFANRHCRHDGDAWSRESTTSVELHYPPLTSCRFPSRACSIPSLPMGRGWNCRCFGHPRISEYWVHLLERERVRDHRVWRASVEPY